MGGLLAVVLCLFAGINPARAQEPTAVQLLTGETGPGAGVVYDLPDLGRGQTLHVYARSTSGNLDPLALMPLGGELGKRAA